MAQFKEAEARLFKDIYVCRKCENKIRAARNKVLNGKAYCRKCLSKAVRPVRKRVQK